MRCTPVAKWQTKRGIWRGPGKDVSLLVPSLAPHQHMDGPFPCSLGQPCVRPRSARLARPARPAGASGPGEKNYQREFFIRMLRLGERGGDCAHVHRRVCVL